MFTHMHVSLKLKLVGYSDGRVSKLFLHSSHANTHAKSGDMRYVITYIVCMLQMHNIWHIISEETASGFVYINSNQSCIRKANYMEYNKWNTV